MIKHYLQVIKPGIIFGNLLSVIGGFSLAAKGHINYALLLAVLVGVFLIIASSCILNNYIDRDIDQKMERTKNRVLVRGLLSLKFSLVYAAILGITGFILLYLTANSTAILLAIMGFVVYVGVYSLYMKRKSIYSTLIGSLSGATPPVIGYCAVSNKFDTGALILLLIFSLWQMPHFYAIVILYLEDYKAALIPVFPVKRGISVTKYHITLYIVGFITATLMLTLSGYTSYKYMVITTFVNVLWFCVAVQGYKSANDDKVWARKLFIFSIVTIISLSMMMSMDFMLLPETGMHHYVRCPFSLSSLL